MIVVRLFAGLGNQLFQYAFGERLREIYGGPVYYDTDWRPPLSEDNASWENGVRPPLTIENLNVGELPNWHDALSRSEVFRIKCHENFYRLLQKLMKALLVDGIFGEKLYRLYVRKGYYFNNFKYYYDIPKTDAKIKIAYGGFQCEKYFTDLKDVFMRKFEPKVEPTEREDALLREIDACNAVAVHVRLGDYLGSNMELCTPEYFSRGVQVMLKKLKDPVFFVFSDDINMVKKQVKFPCEVKYVNGFKAYQDLRLMTHCKHYVISNSTFSWWGSYLSKNDKKIIIAPSKWYPNDKQLCDIYTPDMIRIDFRGKACEERKIC